MLKPNNSKWKLAANLVCLATLTIANYASAAVLLTDNFNVVSGNSQNVNQDLGVRQAGPLALATYTGLNLHHQVGNTGTDVGQPGGVSNSGYVLLALNGAFQSDLNIAAVSAGILTIEVDMYNTGPAGGGGVRQWVACALRREGQTFPVVDSGEFGFLKRADGGVQVFQSGGSIAPGSWDNAGTATADHWTLIFTDTAGTGSAFVGNGSKVTMINGSTTLGTLTLSQLNRSGLKLGFTQDGNRFAGIDNISISGTLPAISVTGTNQSGGNPFTPSWTAETPNLIAGLSPTTATGDFAKESSGGTAILTDGTIGTSGTIGGFATCGAGGGSGSTLIYALTNVVNGSDVTNIVVYSGWSDGGRQGQYYDLSYSTISQPTTYIPIATVFYLPGSYNGAPANRVTIAKTNGTPLASSVANLKFEFATPPNAGNFNNGYQGYSEIIVQGGDTAAPPPPPSGYLTQDTLPSYAETVVGDQVVFTAGFSNFPPVSLHWQVIAGGTTNNVNTGVVNVTNNDNVISTLTLNNVQTNSSGFYRLKADNATNNAATPSYSASGRLLVSSAPLIGNNVAMNYASQNFPSSASFLPAWPVDTNNLNLIYGFQSGTGPGTFTVAGDFTGGGNFCNADPTILTDGQIASMTSLPNLAFCAGGTLNLGIGYQVIYTLNPTTYGTDLTNITVFGGWQDAGRDEQKYQILYSTVQNPSVFTPLVIADYQPSNPGNQPCVNRTQIVPVSGVLAHNVAALKISWNVSPSPENGWEGYSEILAGGQPSTGFGPVLTNDISPSTASDSVGSQLILTAGFSGATTIQWQKNGTNIVGATGSTLTLNNLQLTDAGAYALKATNPNGVNSSGACVLTVNPAPIGTNNVVTSIATQTSIKDVFTPTWDPSPLANNLFYNAAPSSSGDGDFTGGTFNIATGASLPVVLTDGTFGTIDFNLSGNHAWVTCLGSGSSYQNGPLLGGQFVTYSLPAAVNGYDITNIMTACGWNDQGRDQQSYTVSYATAANPTYFQVLAVVSYNPTNPAGYSMSRATLTPISGVLARNVVALQFDMSWPGGENGFSGYSEMAAYGSPSVSAPPASPQINAQHEEYTDSFTLETPNLVAGQLPSTFGAGVFSNEGCSAAGLTDGILTFGGNTNSASCGADGTAVPYIVFNSASGWNLTNIVTYTLWHDFGRDGQFYNVSYSTLSNPTTFLPLASVAYNPSVPHDGRASGNRIAITPALGQAMLASNVFAVKFDFTPQGTADFGWSGYTEIVLQGSSLAAPTTPVLNPATVSGGNLILTGTGTPNYAYTVITATNLQTPSANWTISAIGSTSGAGVFSNSIPVSSTEPRRFFRVQMP